jgi:FtsH-binding integral membrane protein
MKVDQRRGLLSTINSNKLSMAYMLTGCLFGLTILTSGILHHFFSESIVPIAENATVALLFFVFIGRLISLGTARSNLYLESILLCATVCLYTFLLVVATDRLFDKEEALSMLAAGAMGALVVFLLSGLYALKNDVDLSSIRNTSLALVAGYLGISIFSIFYKGFDWDSVFSVVGMNLLGILISIFSVIYATASLEQSGCMDDKTFMIVSVSILYTSLMNIMIRILSIISRLKRRNQ